MHRGRGDTLQLPVPAADARGARPHRTIAPLRAPVERAFAILKRWYGCRRGRHWSLLRNALRLQLLACVLNLRRALVLSG